MFSTTAFALHVYAIVLIAVGGFAVLLAVTGGIAFDVKLVLALMVAGSSAGPSTA